MKRFIFLATLFAAPCMQAQTNVQAHFDFGKGRNYLTTTVEHLSFDKLGNTFFFVDFDYDPNSPTSAYMEFAREFKNWSAPVLFHIEYNGGLAKSFSINNAYLVGATYSLASADFAKGISLSAMYKYIRKNESPSNFQLTAVWYFHFFRHKFSFMGFADFWREKKGYQNTEFIFLSEPQLWYNCSGQLSVGTEFEFADNFAKKGFTVCPTLAAKWTFR
jgi:hypothetical protein